MIQQTGMRGKDCWLEEWNGIRNNDMGFRITNRDKQNKTNKNSAHNLLITSISNQV